MWTMILVAAIEGYSAGAAVHTSYIDGFVSREACEQAKASIKEPARLYIRPFCVNKQGS